MSVCKDCIHCEVCKENPNLPLFDENQEALCKAFKPKSRFVEVVRCKNCRNNDGNTYQCGGIYCTLHKGWFFEDAFCSYGERREK